jgi:hypothetical protein
MCARAIYGLSQAVLEVSGTQFGLLFDELVMVSCDSGLASLVLPDGGVRRLELLPSCCAIARAHLDKRARTKRSSTAARNRVTLSGQAEAERLQVSGVLALLTEMLVDYRLTTCSNFGA